MIRLTQDISNITGIPKLTLDTLVTKACLCIGHTTYETMKDKENITEVDIGIGILYIKYENESLKYKFIPSNQLEDMITFALKENESPLINQAETTLKSRIEKTYKELL